MSQDAAALDWYFVENGAQAGPFKYMDIAAFVRSGRVKHDTLVWAQGAPGWTPVSNSPLRALLPPAQPAPPLPPPPPGGQAPYQPQPAAVLQQAAPSGSSGGKSLGFGEAIAAVFGKYGTFSGRARRSEFWWFQLFLILGGIVAQLADAMAFPLQVSNGITPIAGAFSLATLIPALAVMWRRLHDTDRSGWNWLWVFLPVIGWIILLVRLCEPGTQGPNRFG